MSPVHQPAPVDGDPRGRAEWTDAARDSHLVANHPKQMAWVVLEEAFLELEQCLLAHTVLPRSICLSQSHFPIGWRPLSALRRIIRVSRVAQHWPGPRPPSLPVNACHDSGRGRLTFSVNACASIGRIPPGRPYQWLCIRDKAATGKKKKSFPMRTIPRMPRQWRLFHHVSRVVPVPKFFGHGK